MVQPFCFPVQPPPQKLLPEHAQTLERYAWESFDPHSQGEYTLILAKKQKRMNYIRWLFTGNVEIVSWILWVTFIWSGVNTVLVLSFSDLPAWECFPAPAVGSGEFHHSHTCTVHRISWSFLPRTRKMVFTAFMWQWLMPWSLSSLDNGMIFFLFEAFSVVSVLVDFNLYLVRHLQFLINVCLRLNTLNKNNFCKATC